MTFRYVCLAFSFFLAATPYAQEAPSTAPVFRPTLSAQDAEDLNSNTRQNYLADGASVSPPRSGGDRALDQAPLLPFAWGEQTLRVADGKRFGGSIAVSGSIAFVGAPASDSNQGATYLYQRTGICSGTTCPWTQKQRLIASDGAAGASFGTSVAYDGTTVFVGAHNATVDGRQSQGAVYVFTRGQNRNFVQVQKLTPPDGAASDCYFGVSVAVSGADALVGATGCGGLNAVINSRGSAYRYHRGDDGVWTIAQKFTASDGGFAEDFGSAVGISADTAVIGASSAFQFGYYGVGAVYVYGKQCFSSGRCNPGWLEKQKLVGSPTSTGMLYGGALAFNGTQLLVGARFALIGDENLPLQQTSGAVYTYTQTNGQWQQQQQLIPSDAYRNWQFGSSIALSEKLVVIGAAGAGWPTNSTGAAYVFGSTNGVWTESQKLVASDGTSNDGFGAAVGIADNDSVLIGAPQGLNNSGQGTLYIYDKQ